MAKIEQSIEVNVPAHAAFAQLTRFEEYPRFMESVQEVRRLDDKHLHWLARAGNLNMEWDAEITQQVPEQCIAWRSTNGPRYDEKIELVATERDRTRLTVTMECDPGHPLAMHYGGTGDSLGQQTEHDLVRFKKFMEKLSPEAGGWPGTTDTASRADTHPSASETPRRSPSTGQSGKPTMRPPWMPAALQFWESPFRMVRRMSEDMDKLIDAVVSRPFSGSMTGPFTGPFAGPFTGPFTGAATERSTASVWTPPVDVVEREDRIVVYAELAGMRREDVHVDVRADRLTLEGERWPIPHGQQEVCRSERCYGRFYRVIELPPGAETEAATASMSDGVLIITVPVRPHAMQPRRLDIQTPDERPGE